MSETALDIIDREIRVTEAGRRDRISMLRTKAAQMTAEANRCAAQLDKQLRCNALREHEFKTTPGSGMLGDRFEEICIHCGWIHTC